MIYIKIRRDKMQYYNERCVYERPWCRRACGRSCLDLRFRKCPTLSRGRPRRILSDGGDVTLRNDVT